MSALLYRLLLWLAAPLALWLGRRQDPARWRERLGLYGAQPLPTAPIWLHAASLGEAKAALLLMAELRTQGYEGAFVATSTTRTGADTLAAGLSPRDRHLYAPYDLPGCVRRALARIRPQLLLVMEVEIWPHLWRQAERRGVPIVLANARLSDGSLNRYRRRLPALWRRTLGRAALILAQSEAVAARYRALGVAEQRLAVAGNLKYSLTIDDAVREAGARLRRGLGGGRPVWLAASTHEGEEAIALACQRAVLAQHPDALLVIVPRHPRRFDAVAALCEASGLAWQRRSAAPEATVAPRTQVYLADTLGELLALYAAADLAWVAGSFVDVGGHNLLEPAACGCPIVVGPDMRNFAEITDAFQAADALVQVTSTAQLDQQVVRLLAAPDARSALRQAAGRCAGAYAQASREQAGAVLGVLRTR